MAPGSPRTKNLEIPMEYPRATPDPKGGASCKMLQKLYVWKVVSSHSGSAVVNPLPGVSERTTNPNYEP